MQLPQSPKHALGETDHGNVTSQPEWSPSPPAAERRPNRSSSSRTPPPCLLPGGARDGLQLGHRAGGGLFTLPSSTDHHSFNRENPQRSSLQQKRSFYEAFKSRT